MPGEFELGKSGEAAAAALEHARVFVVDVQLQISARFALVVAEIAGVEALVGGLCDQRLVQERRLIGLRFLRGRLFYPEMQATRLARKWRGFFVMYLQVFWEISGVLHLD